MVRNIKVTVVLAAMLMALVSVFATGGTAASAQAQSASCDTSASVNGTANPAYGTAGTTIIFTGRGFQPNEDVSFWLTLPTGDVVGTAAPIPGGVNADGTVGPLPFTLDQSLVNAATGRWAITFQGASSHNTAVIYFCVFTPAQATAAAASPTAVSAPPTSTSVPATATSIPATSTSVPATATSAPVVATDTVMVPTATTMVATAAPATATIALGSPTTVATEMPTMMPTTMPTEMPTMMATEIPTEMPTMMPTEMPGMGGVGGVSGTGGGMTPGMPTTGQSEVPVYMTLLAIALSMVGLGAAVRRSWSKR